MMIKAWKLTALTTSFGLVALVGGARGQDAAPAQEGGQARAARPAAEHEGGDLPGPIDSVQDLQDTAKMAFKMADTNNDNQISRKEAVDLGNLLVGGFFFRADANGDGTLSPDEARSARENLLRQKPMLRMVMQRAQGGNAGGRQGGNAGGRQGGNEAGNRQESNPIQGLANLLDGNNDRQLQATELRKAVQTGVDGLFSAADTNRDDQLTPAELNAAVIAAANQASQAAFQLADADNNGALSQEEFDRAIRGPVHALFRAIDTNGDGQVTQQEAQAAQQLIMSQVRALQVPEPGNSPRHAIGNATAPAQPARAPAPAPAPGTAPGTAPAPAPAGAAAPAPR